MNKALKLVAAISAFSLIATAASADNFGSATGGDSANQSGLGGCIYNSSAPTPSSGQQIAVQCDANGNQKTTSTVVQPTASALNATVVGTGTFAVQNTTQPVINTRASYRIISLAFTSVATPTDMFCLPGSATKTVYVSAMAIAINSTATVESVYYVKRTTLDTGGTSTNPAITQFDSASPAATIAGVLYSANPSALGTSAGNLNVVTLVTTASTVAPANFNLNTVLATPTLASLGQPVILRGVNESLCINWNGAALPANFTSTIYAEWEEQ